MYSGTKPRRASLLLVLIRRNFPGQLFSSLGASGADTFTSGSTPVPSQFIFDTGLTAFASRVNPPSL